MSTPEPEIARHLLGRLAQAEILQDPFPHFVVEGALPPEYFRQAMAALPRGSSYSSEAYSKVFYPGTGFFTEKAGGRATEEQGASHHGFKLRSWDSSPTLVPLQRIVSAEAFSRTLLDRFSHPDSRRGASAIPTAKHAWFSGANREYSCVFGLYADPPGYEISPHPDNVNKIVTFLLYLDEGTCGTMLCRPKPGANRAALRDNDNDYGIARRSGRSGLWLDWNDFDVVKEVGGANTFLAFAPNEISYHAVRIPRDYDRPRKVVRGFIAKKGYEDTWDLPPAAEGRV